jgi:hypothetical protein
MPTRDGYRGRQDGSFGAARVNRAAARSGQKWHARPDRT